MRLRDAAATPVLGRAASAQAADSDFLRPPPGSARCSSSGRTARGRIRGLGGSSATGIYIEHLWCSAW
uniref:Uncharacterized protein n=1 Tax=Arundo donax TaxID=35708 RepID=A0A0A9ECS0_ARUDO